jgi:16S rRNA C1402 N4-methylase RsmH
MRQTEKAHIFLKEILRCGDHAIDATAGNGHDTKFLAEQVGSIGHVYAFDLQKESIKESTRRIKEVGFLERVTFFQNCHSELAKKLSGRIDLKIKAVTFNLGYLPGGDKNLTTQPNTTLLALKQAYEILAPDGKISVIAYRGHPGGREEFENVENYINKMNWKFKKSSDCNDSDSPVLFILSKN